MELGYEPFMSDFSDILFDPREHTHTSCLQEIAGCDLLVLIVGKRFGGRAVPQALSSVDFNTLIGASRSNSILNARDKLSVTQLEVLKAIETHVPVFAFVDVGVLNDHQTYEKNKGKPILSQIEFPNIEKQYTAEYIFEFLNFIRHRALGNAITPFQHLDDIRGHLRKQWASFFQRLLYEQRNRREETQRIDYISGQIADIKAAIFASLSSEQLKETAKGSIKFRSLVEFLAAACHPKSIDPAQLLRENISWPQFLERIGFEAIHEEPGRIYGSIIALKDGTHFRCRFPVRHFHSVASKWEAFRSLPEATRGAIISALLEQFDQRSIMMMRHVLEKHEIGLPAQTENEEEPSPAET